MTKCREEFEKAVLETHRDIAVNWATWQAAWEARGQVDAEVCLDVIGDKPSVDEAQMCLDGIRELDK